MSVLIWVQTLFDTMIVFLKEFFEKVNFEKVSRRQQKHENFTIMQGIKDRPANEIMFLIRYAYSYFKQAHIYAKNLSVKS